MPAGHILILTGPSGAGKSTTARALVAASAVPAVHLHGDDFWRFIRKGAIPPYLVEAHAQNGVVMGLLAQAAEGHARSGYFVVVDGIVGPRFLQPFGRLCPPRHYVVLRPALTDAIERCRRRGGDAFADPEPITALYKQFSMLGGVEHHVIDTARHGPDDTLAAVQTALGSGCFRLDESA